VEGGVASNGEDVRGGVGMGRGEEVVMSNRGMPWRRQFDSMEDISVRGEGQSDVSREIQSTGKERVNKIKERLGTGEERDFLSEREEVAQEQRSVLVRVRTRRKMSDGPHK
jgi:hypothetical protein